MHQFRIHIYWMIGLEINAHVSQNIGYSHYIHIGVHLYIKYNNNNFWNKKKQQFVKWLICIVRRTHSIMHVHIFSVNENGARSSFFIAFRVELFKISRHFFATIPCCYTINKYTTAQLDDKWRRNNKIYETENCNARKFIKLPHWDRIQ